MRFARVVLALLFGLAMAGPETHQCPVHDQHIPAHHDASANGHQHTAPHPKGHCTCPQACCPAGVVLAAPSVMATWIAPATTFFSLPVRSTHIALPSPKHTLPFALAPPLALV